MIQIQVILVLVLHLGFLVVREEQTLVARVDVVFQGGEVEFGAENLPIPPQGHIRRLILLLQLLDLLREQSNPVILRLLAELRLLVRGTTILNTAPF